MSVAPLWKEPSWLSALPLSEQAEHRLGYYLGIAALHASPAGTIKALAELVKWPESSFSIAKKRGKLPPEIAVRIEIEVGRDVMPRELLCPEMFVIEGGR